MSGPNPTRTAGANHPGVNCRPSDDEKRRRTSDSLLSSSRTVVVSPLWQCGACAKEPGTKRPMRRAGCDGEADRPGPTEGLSQPLLQRMSQEGNSHESTIQPPDRPHPKTHGGA